MSGICEKKNQIVDEIEWIKEKNLLISLSSQQQVFITMKELIDQIYDEGDVEYLKRVNKSISMLMFYNQAKNF